MFDRLSMIVVVFMAVIGAYSMVIFLLQRDRRESPFSVYSYKHLDDCPPEFKIWAFGNDYVGRTPHELMIRWNHRHGEQLTLRGDECITESLKVMRKLYRKGPSSWAG